MDRRPGPDTWTKSTQHRLKPQPRTWPSHMALQGEDGSYGAEEGYDCSNETTVLVNPYQYTRRFDFFLMNNYRLQWSQYGAIDVESVFMLPILERRLLFLDPKRIDFFLAKRGLGMRRRFNKRRTQLCDISCAVALFGILLTVIDEECTAQKKFPKDSSWSLWFRSLVLISSIVLVGLIYCYHAYAIQLMMIDSGTDDWRIAITCKRILQIIVETVVCSICPLPGTGSIEWPFLATGDDSIVRTAKQARIPIDALLSIGMVLRFYLVGRYMVLHSSSFQDAATRSIAAFNRINVDFGFVTKTLMRKKPIRVLITFTGSFWIIMSWLFTQCERNVPLSPPERNSTISSSHSASFLNSLWLIVITFLSIGYGDVVPHTYCGRILTICTGMTGIGIASALVAIISRTLELTKAEKHVNAFMSDTKLMARRSHAAANVLQQAWYIYKCRLPPSDELRLRIHQRHFLAAVHEFRRIKLEQRKLAEQSSHLLDVNQVQAELHSRIYDLQKGQRALLAGVRALTDKLEQLNQLNRRNE